MNNIDLLKEIINIVSKEIPEVKELKRGCIVELPSILGEYFEYYVKFINEFGEKEGFYYLQDGYHYATQYKEGYKVIGQIHYNDLLRYFFNITTGQIKEYYIEHEGRLVLGIDIIPNLIIKFDLSKPLMEQSKETLTELLEYLKSLGLNNKQG